VGETYLVFATFFNSHARVSYTSLATLVYWDAWSMFKRLDITIVHLYCCCRRCQATIHKCDFTYTLTYLVLGTRRSHLLLLVPLHLAPWPWWWWCYRLPLYSLVEIPHHRDQGQPVWSLVGAARLHSWRWRWWLRRRRGRCRWWCWRRGRRKKKSEWWCHYQ
jgi:hypothetical protein